MTPETRIIRPLPCLKCGYSLEGLKLADRCPECGAEAVGSLRHLVLVDETTLRSLRRGALLVACASLGMPLLYLLMLLGAMFLGGLTPGYVPAILLGLVFTSFPVIGCVGWLALTRSALPDGGVAQAPEHRRRWVRLLSMAFAAGAVGAVLMVFFGGFRRSSDSVPIVLAALAACWTSRNRLGMDVMRGLALRSGALRLARSTRIWRWVNVIATLLLVLSGLVLYPLMLTVGPRFERLLGLPTALIAIGATALVAIATAANAAIAISQYLAFGMLLRKKRSSSDPFFAFTPSPPTVAGPPSLTAVESSGSIAK
jgi:hypothetical protein